MTLTEILHDREWMTTRLAAGRTRPEIAAEIGCSLAHVNTAIADLGLVKYRRPYPLHPLLSDRAWMEAQFDGADYYEIARRAGASQASVRNWIRRHDLGAQYLEAREQRYLARLAEREARRLAARPVPKYPLLRDAEALAEAVTERGCAQVARELGCDCSAVTRACQRLGIQYERRHRGGRRSVGEREPERAGLHFVYRLFDADGICLYVGETTRFNGRLSQHRRRSWGPAISQAVITLHDTRSEANGVEANERQRLQPIHCIEHDATKRLPPGGLIQLILAALQIRPMTQREVEDWLLATGYDGGPNTSAGTILGRLCADGVVQVVEERASSSGRWESTRVYGVAA